MSHFAKIENNIVTQVIVAEEDFIHSGIALIAGNESSWVQTSYNNNFRKNYAGVGYTYDRVRDAFIPPKPYPSWILNEDTCLWDAPVAMPELTEGNLITWDENTTSWIITPITL
jgi:hypothetical protein